MHKRLDGGAGWRGDHLPQHARMLAGLGGELHRAVHQAGHDVGGQGAGKAEVHPGFDERLHEVEHVGRTGAGQAREGVEELFLQHVGPAELGEKRTHEGLAAGIQGRVVQAQGELAGADQGRGVGHDPDHRAGAPGHGAQLGHGHAGHDGEHHGLGPQLAGQGGHSRFQILGLDAQEQVVALGGQFRRRRGGLGQVFPGQVGDLGRVHVVGQDRDVRGAGQSADDGAAHVAGAAKPDDGGHGLNPPAPGH